MDTTLETPHSQIFIEGARYPSGIATSFALTSVLFPSWNRIWVEITRRLLGALTKPPIVTQNYTTRTVHLWRRNLLPTRPGYFPSKFSGKTVSLKWAATLQQPCERHWISNEPLRSYHQTEIPAAKQTSRYATLPSCTTWSGNAVQPARIKIRNVNGVNLFDLRNIAARRYRFINMRKIPQRHWAGLCVCCGAPISRRISWRHREAMKDFLFLK